ncbi:hypothetical protein I4U23_018867 [Adineta vaga]|nr:hypothetical protein I4U23_018867 [Adineta vaga]
MMMVTNEIVIADSLNKISLNKQQMIGAVTTIEQWNHSQRCRFIERLLPLCSTYQLDMLWTVLQVSLHRDYFYTVKSHYPEYHFKRISTPSSRTLKEYRHRRLDGEESFYLSNIDDLQEFRDDDGLPKKSQSVFTPYSKDKISTSVQSLIHKKTNDKNRSTYQSIDINLLNGPKPKMSSRLTQKTARSVMSLWANESTCSLSTMSNVKSCEQLYNWFTRSWSESEQNDFLRRLIMKLDERQHYFISCGIMQRRYRDFISLLPGKIAFRILNYLTVPELSRSRRVCKTWKSIIGHERALWKPKVKEKASDNSNKIQADWETFQKQRFIIKRHWLTGTAHLTKCEGHTERY